MAYRAQRPYLAGLLLILIGFGLFADRAGWFDFSWPYYMIAVGVAMLLNAAIVRRGSMVFPGTAVLLLGLVFLGDHNNWFGYGMDADWPYILLAVGIAFLASYFTQAGRSRSLWPAGILIILGLSFLIADYNHVHWSRFWDGYDWWPIVLLAFGVYLIARPHRSRKE